MRRSTIAASWIMVALAACVKAEDPAPQAQQAPPAAASSAEPDYVKVQHILIAFKNAVGFSRMPLPPGASARTRDAAERLAVELLSRARKGEDFGELVNQYTDDSPPGIYGMLNKGRPTKEGDYARSGMAPAFGDVGFKLKVGEIGMATYDPQKSPFGWHIIKRIE
ncbi:MAG: peptidylprolyl isomerase [Planctomycetota bacterium]